jgi:hypothetical protein
MPVRWVLVLLACLCGCSTTATISLVNGGDVEAKIIGGDRDDLIVTTAAGMEVPVARSEISEIDHPGNTAAVFGALLTAYGTVGIVRKGPTCSKHEVAPAAYCFATFVPATVGASILAWGVVTWWSSSRAARPGSRGPSSFTVPDPPPSSAFEFSQTPVPGRAHGRLAR